ncbi:MAG: choice-of-anchor B family protein, partial [Candidatus Eisenbacteria bacterium]|nr:choice-of-anchor B family protein [Candidatus Eisenbacteria bacterium]
VLMLLPLAAVAQLNVTQLGNRQDYGFNSDIWGYRAAAPDTTELAIMGTRFGTTVIDATDPTSLTELAFYPGPSSTWRDIKTYRDYAYVVNETGDGLLIIDLSVPLSPTKVKDDSTHFSTAHNVYCDTTNAVLYIIGSNVGSGGLLALDLSVDPENPTLLGQFNETYLHDAYVRDGIAYGAAIFDGLLYTIDATTFPLNPSFDTQVTPGAFTHNTWLTDDGSHVLTTDEVSGGHIGIYDVSDPNNIVPVSEWLNPDDPTSIVHNVHVLGDYAYISWYRSGLQILDISDPRFPQRVGYFDTFPGSGSGFDGAWGAYPFSPSGTIYVSDINTGLYTFNFDPDIGTVNGTVTDSVSTAPLDGVSCTIISGNNTIETVASGFYQFKLPPGNYDIQYSKFGYFAKTVNVNVTRDVVSLVDVDLVPLPSGTITGFVGEFGSVSPLSGVLVELSGSPLSGTTNASGEYTISNVPGGTYDLIVNEFGYAPETRNLNVVVGQTYDEDFILLTSYESDDLEVGTGWVVDQAAGTGTWELGDPEGTGGGLVQPEDDHSDPGTMCFVTGLVGGSIGFNDVDGGTTILLSPIYDLSGTTDPQLSYYRWFINDGGANPNSDPWITQASDNGGTSWVDLENTLVSDNSWVEQTFDLDAFIGITNQVRFRFLAADVGGGSIVEAAVDDLQIFDSGGTLGIPGGGIARLRLLPASPNPFMAKTAIRFETPVRQKIKAEIFDLRGRKIKTLIDDVVQEGSYQIPWNARTDTGLPVASGVYFLNVTTESSVQSQKIVLSK